MTNATVPVDGTAAAAEDGTMVASATIVALAMLGMLYCWVQWCRIAAVKLDQATEGDLRDNKSAYASIILSEHLDGKFETMKHLGKLIYEGGRTFMAAELGYLLILAVVCVVPILLCDGILAACAYLMGCSALICGGNVGMLVATYTNVRATRECWRSLGHGYDVAIRGGSVAAVALVSLGIASLFLLISVLHALPGRWRTQDEMWVTVAWYSFGVSSVGLFARVGGGTFTKAADIGADLAGKCDYGLMEDDYRNPACIADHVGDNIGGVICIGADLFGSLAGANCAALVISGGSSCPHSGLEGISGNFAAMMFPMLVSASGMAVCMVVSQLELLCGKVTTSKDVETRLWRMIVLSTLAEMPVVYFLARMVLPSSFVMSCDFQAVTPQYCVFSVWLGLLCGMLIGYAAEHYTSHKKGNVKEIAAAYELGAPTGVILGLAVGYLSCAVPVICLATAVLLAHALAGPYGIALAATGMLAPLTTYVAIDAFDSIADNAAGISEMSGLTRDEDDGHAGELTDVLGGAGSVGNGYAIGSAMLVSTSLIGAFQVLAGVREVEVVDIWYFVGLLLGATLPYTFSAITMRSVGKAAQKLIMECRDQFHAIMYKDEAPNYKACIRICTQASLNDVATAFLLVVGAPVLVGILFGRKCSLGFLQGALICGVQMAISMINTGGAWDNAKKYIENLDSHKDSEQYRNAVIGDTVGDPLKDVSGPSLNVMLNLCTITSVVCGGLIGRYSNETGGPFWLPAHAANI